jgi:NAD(P)-dependent dehydrogenase (short-subunit alcohol dehydrogenase family)
MNDIVKEGCSVLLEDKVVIITGAAQGIGAEFAKGYAKEGAKVLVADVLDGTPTVEAIVNAGGEAAYAATDVTDQKACGAMVNTALEHFGKVDVLINNAAMYGNIVKKPFFEVDIKEWNRVMAVNAAGPFLCTKAVFAAMQENGGKIINVASSVVFEAPAGFPHYVASKGAMMTLTRCLARELGGYNINVNALAPGYTESQASLSIEANKAIAGKSSAEIVLQKRCLKRAALPQDIVGTAVFLGSHLSDFITGQLILIDGGASFH